MATILSTGTPAAERSAVPWAAVLATVGAGLVSALQVGKGAIAAPLLQSAFQVDLAMVGWVTSVFAILGLVGGIAAGALSARWGDRRILLAGLVATLAGAGLGSQAPSYQILLFSRVLEGLGFLMTTVAAPAVLRQIVPAPRQNFVFALWSCFMPTGMALALLTGPLFASWQQMWLASALATLLALACGLALIPTGGRRDDARPGTLLADARRVVTSRPAVLLATAMMLYSAMFFAVFSFLPILLMDRIGAGVGLAGVLSAVASLANVGGNLGAGHLLGRGASRPALIGIASAVMGLAAIGIFAFSLPGAAAFALCVLFAGIGGMIPATILSSTPKVVPSAALVAVAVGLVTQGNGLGQVLAPIAIGAAIETYGWSAPAVVVPLLAVLTIAVARAMRGTAVARA
ncbi:Galactose-proton symporter [bacterium YEK0313]|nr:Galactose-proton symporter [bacterium YEK0313]